MKNIISRSAFFLALFFLPSAIARAQTLTDLDPTQGITGGSFFKLIDEVMNRLPYFLGGLAFLALLYSGAIYISALGDPARMEAAKKNLTWTMIGVLAAASVFIVIKLILWITNPAAL